MAKRKITGIWIPINLWEDENLTRIERDALTEILHFDKGELGCFASNNYFGKILQVSASRVSQVISSLKAKGYIDVEVTYKAGSKEVDRRTITINYLKIYMSKDEEEYEKKLFHKLLKKYGTGI